MESKGDILMIILKYYSTYLAMSQNSKTVYACTYVAQRVYILYTSKKECHESGGTLFLSIWTAADKQVSSSVCSTQMLLFVKIDR